MLCCSKVLQQDDNLGAETIVRFGMKTVGSMDRQFSIDVIAHPTDLWDIGEVGLDKAEVCENDMQTL